MPIQSAATIHVSMQLFERRKYERFSFQKELIIYADPPFKSGRTIEYYAQTINLSQGGILLYTIANFPEKKSCTVRFISNKRKRIEKKALILRVVTEGRPDYLRANEKMYALAFQKVMTKDELIDIIEITEGVLASGIEPILQ